MRVAEGGRLFRPGSGMGEVKHPRCMLAHELGGQVVVLVVEYENHRIVAVGEDGSWLRSVGSNGDGEGQFSYPFGIARLAEGDVVVGDMSNNRLVVLSGGDLSFDRAVPLGFCVLGVAVDDGTGRVFVSDCTTHAVHEVDMRTGRSLRKVGEGGAGSGDRQFSHPCGLSMDSQRQRLQVGDYSNRSIVVLSTADGGLQWVKRISVGMRIDTPLVHPDTGMVVVGDAGSTSGKVVCMDVETEEKTELVAAGANGKVRSLCWVEGRKQLWATQWDPFCIQRLVVDGE